MVGLEARLGLSLLLCFSGETKDTIGSLLLQHLHRRNPGTTEFQEQAAPEGGREGRHGYMSAISSAESEGLNTPLVISLLQQSG